MKKLIRRCALLGSVAVVTTTTTTALALPLLRLTDGANQVVIGDNLGLDASSLDGEISYSGTVGGWLVQLSVASTKPLIGTPYQPNMGLTWNVERTGPGLGTLRLEFTDTDFIRRSEGLALNTSIQSGLTPGGSVSVQSYFDLSNLEFNQTSLLSSHNYTYATDGASVNADLLGVVPGVRPAQQISFSLDVLLSAESGGISRGGTTLRVPDAGSTLSLLGLGVGTVVLFGARRRD